MKKNSLKTLVLKTRKEKTNSDIGDGKNGEK